MRMIDEDKLIEESESGCWDIDLKELRMILEYVPTIDAAPVMLGVALSALREKRERENPKPLTLDELREMDGEPVFIVTKHGSNWDIVNVSKEDGGPYPVYFQRYGRGLQENGYGKTWLAYRNKPKEV